MGDAIPVRIRRVERDGDERGLGGDSGEGRIPSMREGRDDETAAGSEDRQVVESLRHQIACLAHQLEEAREDAARMRRQLDREVAHAQATGEALAVQSLVPALMSLGEATELLAGSDSQVREGLQMIAKGLERSLDDAGFARVGEVAEPFDPDLHEAVAVADCEPALEGRVLRVLAPGFVRKRGAPRVVSPARVVVGREGGS